MTEQTNPDERLAVPSLLYPTFSDIANLHKKIYFLEKENILLKHTLDRIQGEVERRKKTLSLV